MDEPLRRFLLDHPDALCPGCLYPLTGLDADACPECGLRLDAVRIRRAEILRRYGRVTLPQVIGLLALGAQVPITPLAAGALGSLAGLGPHFALGALVVVAAALVASLVWGPTLSRQPPAIRWSYALACLTTLVLSARALFWR